MRYKMKIDLIELKKREITELEEIIILKVKTKLSTRFDLTEEQKEEIAEDRINNNKRMNKLINELIDLGVKEV